MRDLILQLSKSSIYSTKPQQCCKPGANRHYGYIFEEPVDEISGDILIDLENLPPEMKQTILLLVKNAADRDAAQKALSGNSGSRSLLNWQHIFLNPTL
ncbi:hypothetical protein [Enterobacter hormaechei]|uniref:hypothetical protein n=2 Tax=Enterobacter hormaechei TaxID=158836 RepID=UPI0020163174|nr:hypothetical protein [Enterobacter hormaechei]